MGIRLANIMVGTQVRPICDDSLPYVTKDSIGFITRLRKYDRCYSDFYVTVEWDNGTETFLNAQFFRKTVMVIETGAESDFIS